MARPSRSRIATISEAARRWQRDLVDTSGRNRLRNYRDLALSTLDLTPGRAAGLNRQALDRLLSGRKVSLSRLFARTDDDPDGSYAFGEAKRRLAAIHKRALVNSEEKGIDTCFAALGLATWTAEQGADPNAPVILLPLSLTSTGAAAADFSIEVGGDAHLNPVLTHILRSEHDIITDDEEADVAEDPPASYDDLTDLLSRLESSWSSLPGLAIDPRVTTANFSYSTMPLVADLEQNAELLAESDMVAAIAGYGSARNALQSRTCDPSPSQPDADPPTEEFLVLDADSSQHVAINRVLGGESLVIQGPPGTGKSQTIVNLITALMARGRRVLFVAEKRAAIEAVTKRLNQVGLSNLVMDMHGRITSRRDFARDLGTSLTRVSTTPEHDYSSLHGRLLSRRRELIDNDEAIHSTREPWNLSVFEMKERLLTIPGEARTDLRLTSRAARGLDSVGMDSLKDMIEEWIDLGGHTLGIDHPEWSRSAITTGKDAREAFDLAGELVQDRLPRARTDLPAALADVGLTCPETVSGWIAADDLFSGIEATLERCLPEVYQLDHASLKRSLQPAEGSLRERAFAKLFSGAYRNGRKALEATLRQPGELSFGDALSLAREAADQISGWSERSGEGPPRVPRGLARARESLQALTEDLGRFSDLTGLDDLPECPHGQLEEMLGRLSSSSTVAANLPRIRRIERRFDETGISSFMERVGGDIDPELAASAVEHAWLRRVLDDLEFEDQRLANFDSERHSRRREQFVESDREHLDSTPERVQRIAAESVIRAMNENPDETTLVRREAAKKSRHLSIRQLVARAPHVLTSLRPCWTMSPVLAAEMIPADQRLFDVVIFDEASQIPPAEAISSLARAPQAVIAGDSRQLPPTTFFGRASQDESDEEDDEDAMALTSDIESLLDAAGALLRDKMLQWHYRSRDDRLIAFSNSHIYGGALTAFPGAIVDSPVSHHIVPFKPRAGVVGTRSNPDEVERVVDLVLEHARESSDQTLGVIAFGQYHADHVENALRLRLGGLKDPSLDEFFSETNEERFFVKNIERVQGDERDAIILTVGYHKDANGNLPYRFGPILQEGGERRINVAVTRARARVTLVSSFSHHDMDPGRSSAKGVRLLRQYLEYAASGGADLGADTVDIPLNPFELDIQDGLERRGISVTPQYGVSGYRIDFACAHPRQPGRMVLAIEADGASYHSAPTARDRDRLRQQVLEGKGWRFHRIWSTAWFRDREAELDRAEAAFERAVKAADGLKASPSRQSPRRTASEPATESSVPERGPRPHVPRKGSRGRESIADYSQWELVGLARWIESDTLLRTEEDLLRAMMEELGFGRSGRRITEALTQAIRKARG